MAKIVGHTLLAKLGKKRLRPGGVKATNWLLKQADFNGIKMLEVATNMATTSIEIASKYDVAITGVDMDLKAIEKAKENTLKHHVSEKISFVHANATNLPFADNSFDLVLNEAMLTMLTHENKEKAISEYYRVLKPGGKLLTHDVYLNTDDLDLQKEIISELTRAINFHVNPKPLQEWLKLYENHNFKNLKYINGPMTLMTPLGMIRDEGLINTLKIRRRAKSLEHREQFLHMKAVFKKYKKYLGFIAVVVVK